MKKHFKKGLAGLLAALTCISSMSAFSAIAEEDTATDDTPVVGLGTIEAETLKGVDQVWTSIYENQIPDYSGEGFAYLTSNPISFKVEVEEEGMYRIDVRAAQILDQNGRQQTISINGVDYTYNMPYLDKWTDVNFGVFRLKAGVNEIVFKPIYGYGAYDTITVEKAVLPTLTGDSVPCDPKATDETKALMKYLSSVYGKKILTGQQEIYGGGHGVQTSIRYDAQNDQCIDENGKVYTIIEGDYGEDDQGNKFPWHCTDETGIDYVYNTQNRCYGYNDYDQECNYLYKLTGEYPAIRGFDLNCHNPGFAWEDGVTDRMIKWGKNNGIVTISWHCTVPKDMSTMEIDKDGNITALPDGWQDYTYDTKTDFVTANVMVEGTKEHAFYDEAIKLAAAELQRLQDEGIPVIFRPLHEAEGNPGNNADGSGSWFWWAKEGAETYKELWKYLYDKLTNEYGLHNLIWEQNLYAWSDESALWYTGDEYVDIVGFDKYNTEYNRHDGKTTGPNEDAESKIFWSLVDYVGNKKMVSMPENSSIPSIENMVIEDAMWLYFCTWYDGESGAPQFISGEAYQNPETVKNIFQSDVAITLSELPEDLYKWDGSSEDPTPTEEQPTETNPTPTDGDTIVYGDADCNGIVDIADVLLVNQHLLGIADMLDEGKANANVDGNKVLDDSDALNILKSLVDLVTLPIE
ncbi:MAG: glycosyl hydrolase [Oscillospiraceae bacterium]